MVKIICAGFPKTGTKTLYECLKVLGMKHFEVPDMACYVLTEWIQVMLTEKSRLRDNVRNLNLIEQIHKR